MIVVMDAIWYSIVCLLEFEVKARKVINLADQQKDGISLQFLLTENSIMH